MTPGRLKTKVTLSSGLVAAPSHLGEEQCTRGSRGPSFLTEMSWCPEAMPGISEEECRRSPSDAQAQAEVEQQAQSGAEAG